MSWFRWRRLIERLSRPCPKSGKTSLRADRSSLRAIRFFFLVKLQTCLEVGTDVRGDVGDRQRLLLVKSGFVEGAHLGISGGQSIERAGVFLLGHLAHLLGPLQGLVAVPVLVLGAA